MRQNLLKYFAVLRKTTRASFYTDQFPNIISMIKSIIFMDVGFNYKVMENKLKMLILDILLETNLFHHTYSHELVEFCLLHIENMSVRGFSQHILSETQYFKIFTDQKGLDVLYDGHSLIR